ncbi:MAG: hypothetical protein WBE38_15205 [Terracidiphilus sp.]
MNIFVDSKIGDKDRRRELYVGSVFVYSPSKSALELCRLAQEMIEEAFCPFDPLYIHEHLAPEKCAEILGALKPKFIHHPRSKECIQSLLAEEGCDLEKTFFDVPRMRTAFPGDYLKTGIAYAFHPHRDTWYSAPMCQINWWMPIYELNSENCMALHPHYFGRAIKNGSSQYNYQRWTQESRFNAVQFVKADTRVQPHAEEPIEFEPQIRLVCPPGGAYQFSAAHLHSTAPNTSNVTRYSIDFRTVHLDDVLGRTGAANADSACTGTTMGDYLRGTDFAHLPEEVIAPYRDAPETEPDGIIPAGSRA